MLKFLVSLFKSKSNLNEIISGITLMIEDLHQHAAIKTDEAADHRAAADEAVAKHNAALTEVDKATTIAGRLTGLVS